jgi:hypothetical protein
MRNIIFSILALSLASCTWVGTEKQIKVFNKNNPVNTLSSFYLIYPKNGFYKTFFTKKLKENKKSAQEVVETFRDELSENLGEFTISEENIDLKEGFKKSKVNGSQYLVSITINQWKDAYYGVCTPNTNNQGHVTEGAPTMDTVDLTVFIYDVKSKKLLNKQKIENKGCPMVFIGVIPIGKNSPEARLKPMITEWLNNIR